MSTSDSNAHDRIHHRLFSYSEVVEDLLRQVVRRLDFAGSGAWIDDLDWSTLRREPEISTSKKLDRRIRDVVWSVSWRGGPLFLILLIEFQSQPNRFMALRQLTYLSLFYEDLVKSGRIGPSGLLPPALPICLYNGDEPWRSPLALEAFPRELRRFQPRFRYLLIDELKTPVEIKEERNIAGSIFALQQIEKHQQLLPVLEAIDRWLPAADQSGLRHDLLTLVRQQLPNQLLAEGGEPSLEKFAMGVKERLTKELEEVEWKLSNLEQFGQDKKAEGRLEGKQGLLANQLRLKFGPLPEYAKSRLAGAEVDQLEIWAARILTASNLEEVFQD